MEIWSHHQAKDRGLLANDEAATRGAQGQAIVATAHKIARIVYHLLKTGETYIEQSAQEYEEQRRERELRQLTRRASKLGFTLAPASNPVALPAT